MRSVISFPDRGHWGNRNYRGNCSGHVQKSLIEQYQPRLFVDICEGGGTSKDVCAEMGIEYVGLDLRHGQDYTRDDILNQLTRPADMVFSHPAYHTAILYSGNMWGEADPRDHSRCETYEEFLEKSRVMLSNQREATKEGGIYTSLIGDIRKNGEFYSPQADFIRMMPRNELKSVTIKMQHNTWSGSKSYNKMKHPYIDHEYLLIFERTAKTLIQVSWDKALELKREIAQTWRTLIRLVMMKLGEASLAKIYKEVELLAGPKLASNPSWKAKVRQTLQMHHNNVQRGVWAA
ncbi:MAG: hypothetical protein IE928_10465 [Gammaproteobacteria bacterium]|nr:hypothetical protein [Gammaproteobacteria bacterium]